MGDFRKNILQTDFEGNKVLPRKYLARKNNFYCVKSWGKKSYTVVCKEKNPIC